MTYEQYQRYRRKQIARRIVVAVWGVSVLALLWGIQATTPF
jgi:hypothetical protein